MNPLCILLGSTSLASFLRTTDTEWAQADAIYGFRIDQDGIYFDVQNSGNSKKSDFSLSVSLLEAPTVPNPPLNVKDQTQIGIFKVSLIRLVEDGALGAPQSRSLFFSWVEIHELAQKANIENINFLKREFVVANPIADPNIVANRMPSICAPVSAFLVERMCSDVAADWTEGFLNRYGPLD